MNDLNNPVLLHRRHLIIAGQAQAAREDVRAHIHAASGYVGIAAGTAAARLRPAHPSSSEICRA